MFFNPKKVGWIMQSPSDDTDEAPRRSSITASLRKFALLAAVAFLGLNYMTQMFNGPRAQRPLVRPEAQTGFTPTPARGPQPDIAAQPEPATATPAQPPQAAEASPPPAAVEAPQIALLEAKLAKQEEALEGMKAQLADMQEMKAQIGTIRHQSTRALTALTAYGILKQNVQSGEPFNESLLPLYKLAPEGRETEVAALLDSMKPYGENGIATLETLQAEFAKSLPMALHPDRDVNSWTNNFRSLIRIRKEGEHQQGMDDGAILARSEARLNKRDVLGATKELPKLSGPAGDAMAPWIESANAYLASASALSSLQLALVLENQEPVKSENISEKTAAKTPEKPVEQQAPKHEAPKQNKPAEKPPEKAKPEPKTDNAPEPEADQ